MIRFSGRKRKWALAIGSALIVLLCLFTLGLASGGGEQEAAHDGGKLMDLLARGLNFAALIIILFVVIRKTPVKDFFKARRAEIEKKLADLKGGRDAAESRYKELETKLKEFEAKKEEIIEQFKAEGALEKEKIIAEAQAAREKE